ncbi:MAG: hypothetical protein KC925_02335 [Candidatus Doudnabacteria bacterium]|nr:hypothetical protein [Candidatus Doudnabacteria bacterium]
MAIKYTESEADFKARVETITGQPFGEIKVMDIRTLADNVASWAVIYGNGYTLFRKGSYDPYDGDNTVVQELNEGGYVRVVYHAGWKDRDGGRSYIRIFSPRERPVNSPGRIPTRGAVTPHPPEPMNVISWIQEKTPPRKGRRFCFRRNDGPSILRYGLQRNN